MISFLRRVFVDNWARKVISLILAVIVYFVIAQSLTTTKTVQNVGIRVINLPPDKTIEGMKASGLLEKRVDLTLTGFSKVLAKLSAHDVEVVLDGSDRDGEWIQSIMPKHLRSINPRVNLQKNVKTVTHKRFIIRKENLVSEKIEVQITKPIGISPTHYSFVEAWPYRLYVNVKGPKHTVDKIRENGLRKTFDLSDITNADLNALQSKDKDMVSFIVPKRWKEIAIPELSDEPFVIDDENAKFLRIDFTRNTAYQLKTPLPVDLFFFPRTSSLLNASKVKLGTNDWVVVRNGTKILNKNLFVKGVSRNFLNVVQDYLELVVIATPVDEGKSMSWSLQIANAKGLEDRYVARMADAKSPLEEIARLHPQDREEYLRNRFRSYMNRIEICDEHKKPIKLHIMRKGSQILITDPPTCESP